MVHPQILLVLSRLQHGLLDPVVTHARAAGNQPMGPWCYVDAKTCKYPPLNDTTGQSYGWCESDRSRITYDTGALQRAESVLCS